MNAPSEAPERSRAARHTAAIDLLLRRYGTVRRGPIAPVTASTINENYRVEMDSGPLFVRVHHAGATRDAVRLEQRALRWAGDRGIPVILPLPAGDGETIHALDGEQLSVYPWREWDSFVGRQLGLVEAERLGEVLGRIHVALTAFRDAALPEQDLAGALNPRPALTDLAQVAAAVREEPMAATRRQALLAAIDRQRALLETLGSHDAGDFARLPRQPLHGDYHLGNVLADADGAVAAVIDWEMVKRGPPVYELLRCTTFSGLVSEPALMRCFAQGYRRHVALTPDECTAGVELWWRLRLTSIWLYRTRFIDGDLRVDRLIDGSTAFFARFSHAAARTELARQLCSRHARTPRYADVRRGD